MLIPYIYIYLEFDPFPIGISGRPARSQAKAILDEGHLHCLVDDLGCLPSYWGHMIKEFPDHPLANDSGRWNSSIGCTLFCGLVEVDRAIKTKV